MCLRMFWGCFKDVLGFDLHVMPLLPLGALGTIGKLSVGSLPCCEAHHLAQRSFAEASGMIENGQV